MKPCRTMTALSIAIVFFMLDLSGSAHALAPTFSLTTSVRRLLFRTGEPGVLCARSGESRGDSTVEIAGINRPKPASPQIFKTRPISGWRRSTAFRAPTTPPFDGLHIVIGERVVEGRSRRTTS